MTKLSCLTAGDIKSIPKGTEKVYYNEYLAQSACDIKGTWGEGEKALIISDRCPGRAYGLCNYLEKKTDLSVEIAATTDEAGQKLRYGAPDILIFVGYQENTENYKIKELVYRKNPFTVVVMFALLDSLINNICHEQEIPYMFSSSMPLQRFVTFLIEIYSNLPQERKRNRGRIFNMIEPLLLKRYRNKNQKKKEG